MRLFLILLLVWSELQAAVLPSRAVIFIDSSVPTQANLITEINQMLFYSPTLRSRLQVEVFDLNNQSMAFAGGLSYAQDKDGQAAARYRPQSLPFLICLGEEKNRLRTPLENKEQLCLCL